jgi:hypothetical protein
MAKSVYIESSVVSYLTSRPSRDLVIAGHQASTHEWWNEARSDYEVFISSLVIEEISAGDESASAARLGAVAEIPSLGIKPEAEDLAELLRSSRGLFRRIAAATLFILLSRRLKAWTICLLGTSNISITRVLALWWQMR